VKTEKHEITLTEEDIIKIIKKHIENIDGRIYRSKKMDFEFESSRMGLQFVTVTVEMEHTDEHVDQRPIVIGVDRRLEGDGTSNIDDITKEEMARRKQRKEDLERCEPKAEEFHTNKVPEAVNKFFEKSEQRTKEREKKKKGESNGTDESKNGDL